MPRISQLTSLSIPDNDDELVIVDTSASVTKKITREDFFAGADLPPNSVNTDAYQDDSVTADKTSFGGNYTTSEVDTGFTWVGGETIYKKTIDTGALPNNTTKTVPHGITGLDRVISLYGWADDGTSKIILPFVSTSASVAVSATSSNISITSTSNRSGFTTSYITLEYTKT